MPILLTFIWHHDIQTSIDMQLLMTVQPCMYLELGRFFR